MRKLAFAAMLALPVFAHAQANHPRPQAKDNTIFIQTPDSAVVALRKLGQVFVSQGYTVEKFDKEFLTLTLAPKALATRFSPLLLARASSKSGANAMLQLAGDWRAVVVNQPLNEPAEMKGSEKGIPTTAYRALEKIALSYPGGQVNYGKQ